MHREYRAMMDPCSPSRTVKEAGQLKHIVSFGIGFLCLTGCGEFQRPRVASIFACNQGIVLGCESDRR